MKNVNRRRVLGGMATAGAFTACPAILTRPVRAQSGPIRIAVVCPQSGAFQPVGAPIVLGAQIAADQVNAAGGVGGRMIELVLRDDKGDPTQSVAAARELVADGVNMIVGVPPPKWTCETGIRWPIVSATRRASVRRPAA